MGFIFFRYNIMNLSSMTISKFFDAVSKLQPNLSDYSDEHKRVCGVREVVLENLGINNAAASITPRRRTRRALL